MYETKLRYIMYNVLPCHRNGHAQAILLLEAGQLFRVRAQQGTHRRLLALHHLLQARLPSTPRARQDRLLSKTNRADTPPPPSMNI